MIFMLFAVAIVAAFFVSSLILMNYGRQLGLRYRQQLGAESMAGLPSVEGAVFALIGLLVAFTVSGALHRFDERRQLVLQEANAVSTAFDRLDLFEGEAAKNIQKKLKEYVRARIELYRMPHDFSLWEGAQVCLGTNGTKFTISRSRSGMQLSQFAHRPIFSPRVRWSCQPLAPYSTSSDCVLARPISIHLKLSM